MGPSGFILGTARTGRIRRRNYDDDKGVDDYDDKYKGRQVK